MQPDAFEPTQFETPAPVLAIPPVESKPHDPFWDYIDLALVIGFLTTSVVIILVLVAILVLLYPPLQRDQTPLAMPLQFVFYLFVYLSLFLTLKIRHNRPVFSSLGWRHSTFRLPYAGLGGVLLAFGLSGLASLLHTPEVNTPMEKLMQKLTGTPFSLFLLAVTAVVLAPIFEELLFRGFLQPLLSRTFGIAAGIIVTALFFGGLHSFEYLNVWQYVAAVTVVGIALGALRARTGSIIPGVVMHGCFNAVSIIALIANKFAIHK